MDEFKILVDDQVKFKGNEFIRACAYWIVITDNFVGFMQFFINDVLVLTFSRE